jgi:tetratricopeptide (TPR) repeat protein
MAERPRSAQAKKRGTRRAVTSTRARPGVESALARLTAAELVRAARESERAFLFKHAVVQDTAYQSLLKQERKRLHRAIGTTLERLYTTRADEFAAELTYHFAQAGDDTKTLEYGERAGDADARIFAFPEAHAHYSQALDAAARLPATPDLQRRRVDLIVKVVSVALRAEGPEASLTRLRVAEELLGQLEPTPGDRARLARVHFWMGDAYSHQNQQRKAVAYLQQAMQAAQAEGTDENLLAIPANVIGRALAAQGQFGQAEPLLAQAAPLLEKSANWYEWVLAVGFLGMAQAAQGDIEAGLGQTARAFARAQDLGTPIGIADSHIFSSFIYMQQGAYTKVIAHADAALAAATQLGDHLMIYMASNVRGWGASRLDRFAEAEADLRRGQELAAQMGGQLFFADLFLSAYAELAWRQGQAEVARERAARALEVARVVGNVYSEGLAERVMGLAIMDMERTSPNPRVESHFRASLQLFQAGNARLEAARTRMVWGNHLRARGEEARAREHFAEAAAQFQASRLDDELQAALHRLRQGT